MVVPAPMKEVSNPDCPKEWLKFTLLSGFNIKSLRIPSCNGDIERFSSVLGESSEASRTFTLPISSWLSPEDGKLWPNISTCALIMSTAT